MDVKAHVFGAERKPAVRVSPALGGRVRRLLGIGTVVSIAAVLALGLLWAPEDAIQGPAQRIFYIHVPSAWVGFLAFFVVFVSSIGLLVTGAEKYDDVASASAELGLLFTTAVLITGPLWGRPVWGVYWTWDPRLTSYLMLWLIYVSYLVLRGYVPDAARRARYSAVVGIVGFLDVPIVYLSVRWWRSEHPLQVVFERNGLPAEMLVSLLVGVLAFTLLFAYLLTVRLRVGRLARRAEEEVERA